jgi:hypothetical protein
MLTHIDLVVAGQVVDGVPHHLAKDGVLLVQPLTLVKGDEELCRAYTCDTGVGMTGGAQRCVGIASCAATPQSPHAMRDKQATVHKANQPVRDNAQPLPTPASPTQPLPTWEPFVWGWFWLAHATSPLWLNLSLWWNSSLNSPPNTDSPPASTVGCLL